MQSNIQQSLDRMVDAWGRGDARAYAEEFTEDATYVIFAGSVSVGREAICRDHVPVLTKWQKGSTMRVVVRSVRHLTDDVAVVLTEGGVSKGRRNPLNKTQTFVFARQSSGEWLCSAFQNTKKNRLFAWVSSRSSTAAV